MTRPIFYRRRADGTVTPVADDDLVDDLRRNGSIVGTANPANRIAETVGEGIRVSTVFLGIDHGWCYDGPPILYETMIFWPGHDLDGWTDRCTSEDEARAGHEAAVALVQAELGVIATSALPNRPA